MDEQRLQAYSELIEQLLGCPQGKEWELLQSNAELMDAGLVEVMGQFSEWLESKGQQNAGWLKQFSEQVAQMLGLVAGSQWNPASQNAMDFGLEMLELIVQVKGDQAQIYEFFQENLRQLDEAFLQVLPSLFSSLKQQSDPSEISFIFVVFGNRIQKFPFGSRWLNLEMSITAYKQALSVMNPATMPIEWARATTNLANAYKDRIRGDRAKNIEKAITGYRQALSVITQASMPNEWATISMNLASAYSVRIQSDRAENIEQAIRLYKQSLLVRNKVDMPIKWATTMMNLACTYKERIKGDRAENFEQAIVAFKQALLVITRASMPLDWATTIMNLASAYRDRVKGDRTENIEQSIRFYEQVLLVRTQAKMPLEWAQATMNLAIAYQHRIKGDRTENIEQAIGFHKQALSVMVAQASMLTEWTQSTMNLATAYGNRVRGDRAENLEQAIFYYKQVLSVATKETMPVEWSATKMNLGSAYSNRITGNRADNIEKAITAYQESLLVNTQEKIPFEWAITAAQLANAYFKRVKGNQAENFEKAIVIYEQALGEINPAMAPLEWANTINNLATVYSDRIRGDRTENLEQAIAHYYSSLTIFESAHLHEPCRRTARNLGNLFSDQQRWSEARAIYQTALQAAEILYQSANLLDSKAAELAETADLPRRAAYALARNGDLQTAIRTLEQGRARGLSESLDRDRANLEKLQQQNSKLYDKYKNITQQLRNLESQQRDLATSSERHSLMSETLQASAIGLRQQLNKLIQAIRQEPDYQDFLALPTLADVRKSTKSDRPLVYLLSTPNGSLALVVTPEDIQSIWLDDLTEEQLREILHIWFAAYRQSHSDRQSWYDAIDAGTRQLWGPLMQPLIHHLKTQNFTQATLIPTGYLSLLPLHAAWTEDPTTPTGRRYALDDIHFTYAPNAKSLTAAKEIADRVTPNSILAIDNPKHRSWNQKTERYEPVNPLLNSSQEVESAISTFPSPHILRQHQATREAVLDAIPHTTILHCACHGNANLNDPLTNGLAMTGEGEAANLTLKDIFALNLANPEKGNQGLRLAILSACETGMIGTQNADEAISLPTGLLQAGVAAVIASLWAVQDDSTMLLLSKFYDLWRKDNLEPSQALREAQLWLRDSTEREIAPLLGQRTRNPDNRPFAHPYYWSAFSYTGI